MATRLGLTTSVLVCLVTIEASSARGQEEAPPRVYFTIDPCPANVPVPPGLPFRETFDLVIVTEDNATDAGLQGWSISIAADAVAIVDIATDGTLAAPITEGGLRDNGFVLDEVGQEGTGACTGRDNCAITAVVLSFTKPVTLPPSGPARVAKLVVAGDGPAELYEAYPALILFIDGCKGSG
jgi:hypothetical protein